MGEAAAKDSEKLKQRESASSSQDASGPSGSSSMIKALGIDVTRYKDVLAENVRKMEIEDRFRSKEQLLRRIEMEKGVENRESWKKTLEELENYGEQLKAEAAAKDSEKLKQHESASSSQDASEPKKIWVQGQPWCHEPWYIPTPIWVRELDSKL